ncbi:30S ribosomal protein S8 [Candidatus Woesearchaeota archaeon]|nr:30S ribosomal protein S8 [Candidatus Woesearchaeota archaeon]
MSMNDPLSQALSKIMNAERTTKSKVTIIPTSKTIMKVLELMQQNGYIATIEVFGNEKKSGLTVTLSGTLNECKVIKPRFDVTKQEIEKFEKRFLPARGFGSLIISTSKGVMTHQQAREQGLGGKLLAYVY